MMMSRASFGKTASRLARIVVANSESSLQRGITGSKNVPLSTMSGLNVSQQATRLAAVKIPLRQLSAGSKVTMTPEMKAVEAATNEWKDTVTLNTDDAPKKTAALYAPDSLFWGTVSEEVRSEPEHVRDYFDFFARLPKLRLVAYDPVPPRVHGKFAVHAGAYTFAWQGADGETVQTRARFTFAYRLENDKWVIVEHHSSSMPTAPAGLK
ncbi:unnamed protein product, partial [Scytosiphon promiscuus]